MNEEKILALNIFGKSDNHYYDNVMSQTIISISWSNTSELVDIAIKLRN